MGTHLSFSTAFYPQSQGQVERVWCYFEARVWKRIVALSFLSFLSFFEGSLAAYFDYEIWQMHVETTSKRNKISEMIFSRTRKDRGLEGQARGATEGPQACPSRPWGGKASQCFREIYNLLICIFIGFKNIIYNNICFYPIYNLIHLI